MTQPTGVTPDLRPLLSWGVYTTDKDVGVSCCPACSKPAQTSMSYTFRTDPRNANVELAHQVALYIGCPDCGHLVSYASPVEAMPFHNRAAQHALAVSMWEAYVLSLPRIS